MSDATPRDELAQVIQAEAEAGFGYLSDSTLDAVSGDGFISPREIAGAVIAAGWRPPTRTITEVRELEELPVRSVVADESGLVLVCLGHRYANVAGNVWASEHGEWHLSRNLRLPMVVLREPEEGE